MNKSCKVTFISLAQQCLTLFWPRTRLRGRSFGSNQVWGLLHSTRNLIVFLAIATIGLPLARANDGVVGTSINAGVRPHAEDWEVRDRSEPGTVSVARSVYHHVPDGPYAQTFTQNTFASTHATGLGQQGFMVFNHRATADLLNQGTQFGGAAQFGLHNLAEAYTKDFNTQWNIRYSLSGDVGYVNLGLNVGGWWHTGSGQTELTGSNMSAYVTSLGSFYSPGRNSASVRASVLWSIDGAPMLGESLSSPLPAFRSLQYSRPFEDEDAPASTGGTQISGVNLISSQEVQFPIISELEMGIDAAAFVSFEIDPLVSESVFESHFFALENYFTSIELTDSFADFDSLQLIVGDQQIAVQAGQKIDFLEYDIHGIDIFSLIGNFTSQEGDAARMSSDGLADTFTMGFTFAEVGTASFLIAGVPEPSSALLISFCLTLYGTFSRRRTQRSTVCR